jgi:hypothetical protein
MKRRPTRHCTGTPNGTAVGYPPASRVCAWLALRYVQARETMVKTIIIIGLLSFAVPFNSYANDSDRIDQLEKEIQETKLRLLKLESLLSNPSNAQKPVTSGEGWKSIMNWRKLTTDMSTSDVQKILGEPHRVDGGTVAMWYYQNGGRIMFMSGKVSSWTEPYQ